MHTCLHTSTLVVTHTVHVTLGYGCTCTCFIICAAAAPSYAQQLQGNYESMQQSDGVHAATLTGGHPGLPACAFPLLLPWHAPGSQQPWHTSQSYQTSRTVLCSV